MADPNNEEAARALERLAAPQSIGPTPQPKPRAAAPANPAAPRPSAPGPARPSAPASSDKPSRPRAPAPQDLQQAVASARSSTSTSAKAKTRAGPPGTSLTFRRTLIPILLTAGFILVALAVTHYAWKSDENPVIELSTPIVLSLFATGTLAWLLAAANILSVRRALRDAREPNP